MTEELKPCPFCGGSGSYSNAGFGFIVKCRKCGSKTSIQESGKEAADAWNNRSIEDLKDDENAWLEKNLKDYNRVMLENARLREALEEIARGFDTDSWYYTREVMMRIAKEALK